MWNKRRLALCTIFAILAISSVASLLKGTYYIPLDRFIEILLGNASLAEKDVFWGMRFPRLLLALAVGGSLSLAGVLLQAIFRNPLVEPYTVGISGGASFAVCIVVTTGLIHILGPFSIYFSGFSGASLVIFILYFLNARGKIKNINTLLLSGIMMSFIFSSLIMLVLSFSHAEDAHSILFWLMGALDHSTMQLSLFALFISFMCLCFVFFFFHELDALLLGEEQAYHLGINVARAQLRFFLVAALLTAVAVSLSGIIGFVGLAIPMISRKLLGNSHRYLLVGTYLAGAAFLSICDLISRTIISPRELPVGVITGIIGGTLFVWTLLKPKSQVNS
jgi:iron complex transport system permease protein